MGGRGEYAAASLWYIAWIAVSARCMPIFSPTDFAKEQVQAVQDYSLLAGRSLSNVFARPRYFADTLLQADQIGVGSLPIVVLTGFFTGAVLALQTSSTLQQFGSISLTGKLVSLSMVRELGPVLTGLMVAGRNSSGMASELGSMKVTEQIDAMRAMGVDPSKKLVTPRVMATVVMLFFLSIISDLVGLDRRLRDFIPAAGTQWQRVLDHGLPGACALATFLWDSLSRQCSASLSPVSAASTAYRPRAGRKAWAAPPPRPWWPLRC